MVNWVKTDLWHPDNNSDRPLKAESAQMRYLFEGMTSPVKKESVGVREQ
jgi:hypothetical protein